MAFSNVIRCAAALRQSGAMVGAFFGGGPPRCRVPLKTGAPRVRSVVSGELLMSVSRMARYIAGFVGVHRRCRRAKEPAQGRTCVVDAGGLHRLDERTDARAAFLR